MNRLLKLFVLVVVGLALVGCGSPTPPVQTPAPCHTGNGRLWDCNGALDVAAIKADILARREKNDRHLQIACEGWGTGSLHCMRAVGKWLVVQESLKAK